MPPEIDPRDGVLVQAQVRSDPLGAFSRCSRSLRSTSKRAAEVPPRVAKVERILPRVVDGYRELVDDLSNALKRDMQRARANIRRLLGGQIRVEVDAKEARFMTQKGRA